MSNMAFTGVTHSSPVVVHCTKKDIGFQFHNFIGAAFEHLMIANCGQFFYTSLSKKKTHFQKQVCLMSQLWNNVVSMHDHLLTVHAHKI